MQKKIFLLPIIALTSILSLSYVLSPIYAVSPTPIASPSPATDQDVTENLKRKILENLDKAKETITSPIALAYIGIVKDVIKDTIIMQDKDGKKDIKLEADTVILRTPGNAIIKADNIRIDDYVIAIGYPGADNSLTGRRLIVSIDPIKPPAKQSGIGTILKIGKTNITLKIDDNDQVVTTTTKTLYKSSVGTIESTDLTLGDKVIYAATIDDKENLAATILMRIQTGSI